jgi:predicted transcriptional regulator
MPVSGDIQTFSLAAIGRMIHAEKKTGILNINSEDHCTNFYFRNGMIIFINADLDEEFSLKSLLLADYLITADNLQEAAGIAKKEDKGLCAVLMEQGFVSKENLVRTLQYQFKEAMSQALTWKEGVFEYKDGLNGFVEDVQLEIDPTRLLSEAEKWKEYRVLIPDDRVVFRIKNADFRFTSIPAEGVHRVMLMIDGERNVYEIMNETGLTRAAIYKALKNLFLQGVIEREQRHTDTDTGKFLNKSVTMRFFLKLVGEIMADLAMELGKKKSESILDNSTKATNHAEFFLQTIKVGESTETNIQRMNAWMVEQQRHISARDLFNGFKNIITFLLREEYHLLGFKSLKNTIQRVLEISDTIPQEEKTVADSMIGFLKRVLNDEKELVDTEGSFNGLSTDDERKRDHDTIPFPHLSQIGGATVIAFYCRILQIIMDDLDAAIGSKSDGLISKIMATSPYH